MSAASLTQGAHAALMMCDPTRKVAATRALQTAWDAGRAVAGEEAAAVPVPVPGRPARPRLVPPRVLPKRGLGSREGRAALIHALCHIEFNAINLGLDAVYRFRGLPPAYYGDWLRVAAEEALHFELLQAHLASLGYAYGDFDAHDGLWEMACETAHDVVARMALVPRVLEARGLDVTPGLMERLAAAGDARAVEILTIILRDEKGHVAVGSRWYRYACAARGLEPGATFKALIARHMKGRLKGPFHWEARREAGFSDDEMTFLEGLDA
ncbi:ferritin-like domain-containing protein [Ectothiorhodospiraceae bacterium 2226]|nr:ferritin-like domain-containing protein [Ectothiorhodospiraceae bacterium 2226]